MSNLVLRTLTALIGGTLFILLLTVHLYTYYLLWAIIGIICTWEWKKMFSLSYFLWSYMMLSIFVLNVSILLEYKANYGLILVLYTVFILFLAIPDKVQQVLYALLGILYLAIPLVVLFSWVKNEPFYFRAVFVAILVWISDISAYFVGRYWGRHPLFLRISPKKTVEGLIASFIACGIAVFLAFELNFVRESKYLWIGIIVTVCTPIGDLVESAIKRYACIKDSSQLLPGHGGFLDRFDGFFFSVVAQSWI
ncbi:MAG: phosphatidate cytidylyltransferase [Bacteroidia bacterium]|nr:phosphatidate cytidylyltransferase [Bacteroidia bacterium]